MGLLRHRGPLPQRDKFSDGQSGQFARHLHDQGTICKEKDRQPVIQIGRQEGGPVSTWLKVGGPGPTRGTLTIDPTEERIRSSSWRQDYLLTADGRRKRKVPDVVNPSLPTRSSRPR